MSPVRTRRWRATAAIRLCEGHGAVPAARSRRPRVALEGDLLEPSVLDAVDEPADVLGVPQERALADAPRRVAQAALEIAERARRPGRALAHLSLQARGELLVGEGEHPAVGVVDEDDPS